MTDSCDDPTLLTIAITLADGFPVDWEGLREAYPVLAGELETLRLLETIGREAVKPPP